MSRNTDILIFGAHPDDAEIGMGGTIAKHALAGYRVAICDLTYAEMSSNGSVETRKAEAKLAADVLRLADRSNLGLPDRGLVLSPDYIQAITAEIRKYRPRIVFAPYWQDRHPDHVACSRLVQEAAFNAKLRRYLPDLQPVAVEQFYFYFINDIYEADMVVDVSSCYEMKMNALRAYATQFEAAAGQNDFVQTPINQGYLEQVEARDRMMGLKRLVRYAEGFVAKNPMMINLF